MRDHDPISLRFGSFPSFAPTFFVILFGSARVGSKSSVGHIQQYHNTHTTHTTHTIHYEWQIRSPVPVPVSVAVSSSVPFPHRRSRVCHINGVLRINSRSKQFNDIQLSTIRIKHTTRHRHRRQHLKTHQLRMARFRPIRTILLHMVNVEIAQIHGKVFERKKRLKR